ncbi:MAG: hypothetical protein U5N27_19020 [Rhizobium sp.]|nr:hypothetical protein [Rhizobium sp.]
MRQLRIAAHLSGEYPYLLEAPAGFIDDGETAIQAAVREALRRDRLPDRQGYRGLCRIHVARLRHRKAPRLLRRCDLCRTATAERRWARRRAGGS